MHKTRILLLAFILFPFSFTLSYAGLSKAETIEISKREGAYELTVPVSRLIMIIPEGGLSQAKNTRGGSADNPAISILRIRRSI